MSNKSWQEAPSQNHRQFNEDTIYGTPVPQAASTANRESDNRYSVDVANIVVSADVEKDPIMEDAVSKIWNLQQMLQTEFEHIKRLSSRLSTTSSLGILRNNEVESVSAIFDPAEVCISDEKNQNNEMGRDDRSESLPKNILSGAHKVEEVLADVSVKSGLGKSPSLNCNRTDMDLQLSTTRTLPSLDLMTIENMSVQNEQFHDGESAVKLLKQDEEEWLRNKAELPLISQNKSLSGIYSDYSCVSNSLSMLNFLRKGSYPLGSSLSDINKSDERPHFGREINSPGKKYHTQGPKGSAQAPDYLDKIPVKEENCDRNRPIETSQSGPWTLSALMEQYSIIHDNNGSKCSESSSLKSMMSISEVANMLENMTCASPQDLFDNLIKQASINETGNKTISVYQEKENITPIKRECSRHKFSCSTEELSRGSYMFGSKKQNEKERGLLLSKNCESALGKLSFQDNGIQAASKSNLSETSSVFGSSFHSSFFDKEDDCKSVDSKLVRSSAIHDSLKSQVDKGDQYKLLSESLDSSGLVININEKDENEVDTIPVCIATPITMDFDLNNDRDTEQHCTIMKDVLVDGKSDIKAAIIQMDSNKIVLKPYEKRMISIIVSPLVPKEVTIQLTISRVDVVTKVTELYKMSGKILGEFPRVKILNERLDFGKLPEECVTQKVLEIMNFGQALVPISICINQFSDINSIFYLDQNRSKCAEVVLYPGEKCQQTVICVSPSLSGNRNKKSTEVSGSLNLCLRIPNSLIKLPELENVLLTLCVVPCSLKFSTPLNRVIQMNPGSDHKIHVTNMSSIVLNIAASVNLVEFAVEPNVLRISSDEKACVCVRYHPLKQYFHNSQSRKATLTLQVLPRGKIFEFYMVGETALRVAEVNLVTPVSSRAPSPLSPTSSMGSAVGSLQLQCNYKALVWANCALHSKNIKTCVFRNHSAHREKLLFAINDSHKCFKILKEQKKLDSQLHLSLQPMESTTVSVVMLPTFVGPLKGILSITRIGRETERKEKNMLPLYGYGGKSRLVLQQVMRNPDQQMWIYLDSDTLSCKFIIKNFGDAAAFVKISQGIEATGVSLYPPECIVDASSEVEVEVSLSATPDRLEHLLQKPADTVIRVVGLTVTYGDEATLHRLRRLYLTHNLDLSDINSVCHSSFSSIISLFANRESDTLILKDPKSGLETLWQEGIQQWNIGVLVERTVLEVMRLDTSLDFTGLRTDLEETVYNLASVTVTPESLTLSQSCSYQDLFLLNSDTRSVGFHCYASQGLQVNPKCGTIRSKSSVEVRVYWDTAVKSSEPLEIKVTTGHGCEVVVPVKCD